MAIKYYNFLSKFMRMQSKKPSLTEVKSYSEAIQVLNIRQAPNIFKKTVDMIFKVDQREPLGKSYVKQMLAETEVDLKKVEEEKILGSTMHEMEHDKENTEDNPFTETEGNPPAPNGTPKETPGTADKTGTTAQSDGSKTGDVKPPGAGSHNASKPAQEQQGISQLKEAITQVADIGSIDPINKAMIGYMDSGMSKTEASVAATMDNNFMEAVFNKKMAVMMPKILNPFVNEITRLQETIKIYDAKIEEMRVAAGTATVNPGFSEAVMIQPTGVQSSSNKTSRFEEMSPGEISQEIAKKYIDLD